MYAFDNLPPGNKILEFMVSWHCNKWDGNLVDGRYNELISSGKLPYQFLAKVMMRYGKHAANYDPVPMGPRSGYVEREVIAVDDE